MKARPKSLVMKKNGSEATPPLTWEDCQCIYLVGSMTRPKAVGEENPIGKKGSSRFRSLR